MEPFDTRSFEQQLRTLIEAGSMDAAEAMMRAATTAAAETALVAVLDRPLESMAIENWISIGADMKDAKRKLPPAERGQDWKAVFVGLVNHTGRDALYVETSFGLESEPQKPSVSFKPTFMTDAEFEVHKRELAARNFLPEGRRYRHDNLSSGLRLIGLEEAWEIEVAPACDGETADERTRRWRRQTLAAAIILLRFHQLVERYASNPGLPQPIPLFAHVVSVEWPMEQGIHEFGTQAIRSLRASSREFDMAAAEDILETRAQDRRDSYLADTRRIICELREKQEALALWPMWRNLRERMLFSGMVRADRKVAKRAMKRMHGIDASRASGEALYRLIAKARNPTAPEQALDPPAPENRTDLHRVAIAFAKRFGGEGLQRRFADCPEPPAGLLDHIIRR